MSKVNSCLDSLLEQWYLEVYRFCFLLSCHGEAAREIAFQTFLYAGADEHFPNDEHTASLKLFSYAYKTCEDYYLRRLRRRPGRVQLQQSVDFPVSDALWSFLHSSPEQKGAIFLCTRLGFSPEEISVIMKLRKSKLSRILAKEAALSSKELDAILPDSETLSQISDELYLRFEERSVGLENRLRSLRLSMDRAIIWIALGILLLFAAAALYTARL